MLLFTGASDRITDADARKDQDDLVRTLRGLSVEDLRPKESTLAALWRKTKALSATSVEKMMDLTDKAREQAKPTIDAAMQKAKDMAEEAKKQGQVLIDKAQKATGN